ncbi:MAG: AGE family epimerase/isomerase, partial [Nitrospinota bacterium]|nr:AGE family epimerase/isomerase [Nitrospinota bacterium]
MRKGGIWDHIGFGFHRYSTDKNWLLPHFEKMLYDQAMISMAYLEAFQITGNEDYGRTVREIYTYVLRDMTSPEGGFYSAEDADSEGEEGKFYLWTTDEVQSTLGVEEGKRFNSLLNIMPEGNFRDEASSQKIARNIPHIKKPVEEVDLDFMEKHRKNLFEVREKRIHPLKDDKILTDWNGLMITSFAKGSVALNSPEFYDAARKGAGFILKNLRSKDGRLLKRYRQGKAGLQAHLDDYVFVIWGLLELYEAGFEEVYLQEALNLSNILVNNFWDEANGGFFLGSKNAEKL